MTIDGQQARLTALAALKDPLDRRCFNLVAASGGAVGRDEIAEALGLPRASAAFRLDRLVEVGLLDVEFRRRSGRTGPGAGRPAKLYRVVLQELGASVPERHYELAADILATVMDRAGEMDPLRAELASAAFARGIEIGRTTQSLDDALERGGYEPIEDGPWQRLTNCPFHQLARSHTATICAVNHALLQGVLQGAGADPQRAEFKPDATSCCVRVRSAER
jgi:predicted ArsR family transcriptional regulator